MDAIVNKVEDMNLTEEDKAILAARILNLGTLPAGAYLAFKEELDDDVWTELESRILDGD